MCRRDLKFRQDVARYLVKLQLEFRYFSLIRNWIAKLKLSMQWLLFKYKLHTWHKLNLIVQFNEWLWL